VGTSDPSEAPSRPGTLPAAQSRRRRRLSRRERVWTALFAVALGVLIFLLVLIGIGYLRLPQAAGATVTVTAVDWTIEQGTNGHGTGWFGKGLFNYTNATGWRSPSFAAGTSLEVVWTVQNFDTTVHNLTGVSVGSPFQTVAGKGSPLPLRVNIGDDGGTLVLWVTTASSVSGSYVLDVTVTSD
jgi:hypothetical protein